jgi:hypothetical protein
VKARAKHRKRTQFELSPLGLASAPELDRIAALREGNVAPKSKPTRFVFRENEPLPLTSDGGEQ